MHTPGRPGTCPECGKPATTVAPRGEVVDEGGALAAFLFLGVFLLLIAFLVWLFQEGIL